MKSLAVILLCLSTVAFSVQPTSKDLAPLFTSDELLHISLAFSIDSLLEDRVAESRYFPARLSFQSGFTSHDLDLKIKTRGNFRLDPSHCDFPPIMLNFSKKEVEKTLFRGQNKMKLVTHCTDQEYVLKEYLAYKMYQLISPYSFHVRLAQNTYLDVEQKQKPVTRYAFLLEHKKALSARFDADIVEEDSASLNEKQTAKDVTAKLYLFQYLLGNQDWDIALQKNIKLMALSSQKVVPIPYDFDFTGWVDAEYTLAPMGDLAEAFEYRVPKRFCQKTEAWQAALADFEAKKEEMFKMIESFPHLKKKSQKALNKQLTSFFEAFEEPKAFDEIFGDCL